jgi:signal transduction histidine kinase
MASANARTPAGHGRQGLFSRDMLLLVWLPVLCITALHYGTPMHERWLHDVYRRLYYLPIVIGALRCGLRGGLVVPVAVWMAYSPHAFLHYFSHDPTTTLEKFLEMALYLCVGAICGVLVEREERQRQQAQLAWRERGMARRLLERAERLASLGELVAGIAHEIKNPLHTLKGSAEIVDQIVPRHLPQSAMWQLHQEELQRLERVAERFLSFARPSPPQSAVVTAREILTRAHELVASQANKVNVRLHLELDQCAETVLQADRDQIVQVLIDIALNGFRAMEPRQGGRMRMSASFERQDGTLYVALSVRNSGPTIPEENLERIFEPFFSTREDGTGLGLSTAARIVEQHHGFIQAENLNSGDGVEFFVYLPVQAELAGVGRT